MKKELKVPQFKDEDAEAVFWNELDLSEYLEPADFKQISFPNLKPTSRSISIRFPEHLLNRLKEQANAINVPYQSLVKQFIEQGLHKRL
jgi:predicted DNA binding CopG/RHH family protein